MFKKYCQSTVDKEDLFHHYKQMEVRKLFCSLRAVLSLMLVQGKKCDG